MNTKKWFLTGLAVCFVLSSSVLCMAQERKSALTVNDIAFKAEKDGAEKVAVLCSRACVPALSSLEGTKARLIMDFAGVASADPKFRNVPVSGKYVKRIRSYLDKDTMNLRVVLDMAPSGYFIAHSSQDETAGVFSLSIAEAQRGTGETAARQGRRIAIADQMQKPADRGPRPADKAEKQEPAGARAAADRGGLDSSRAQMNAGDYIGAIKTLDGIIAETPRDSQPYRLRGNAYQNMGDREKAVGDWITAARLGDEIVQSYLEFMQINWKE